MALFWLILMTLLVTVYADLSPNYPVNAQIPPVARVSKPYKFIFSEGTFADSNSDTEYTLSDAPEWLQVDSKSRTLSGTPHSGDVGSNKFNLVATDSSGSASMEVTLVVSSEDGPKPGKPLLPQLEKIGATSAPSTILVHAGDSFSISFDPETFTNTNQDTKYYGTSPDNSPLPSWMEFEESSLKFSGTTPTVGPQTFTLNLIASDEIGFSAAFFTFKMTVTPHIFSFNESYQTFRLTPGEKYESPHFFDVLRLDGNEPRSDDLTNVDVDAPDWLTVDKKSISFSGTPPDDASNENVTISVTDSHQNVASLIVGLELPQSHLFVENFQACNANIGEGFQCVFDKTVLTDETVHLDVDLGSQISSWAQYNADNKTLHGFVPMDTSPEKIDVGLTAWKGAKKETNKITVNVAEAGHHNETNDDSDDSSSGGGIHEKKSGIIAISVIIPLVFLSSIALFLCCARRKRRVASRKAAAHEEGNLSNEKPPFTGPDGPFLPQCQPFEDSTTFGKAPETTVRALGSSEPPKLDLFWNADSFGKADHSHIEANKENTASTSAAIEWGLSPLKTTESTEEKPPAEVAGQNKRLSLQSNPPSRRNSTNQSKKREPLKPIQPRRSMKRNSMASSKSRRYSRRSSGISTKAQGLPVRLSGAGHGAGGFGPPGHGVVRMSWQNTHASLQSEESNLGNLAPLFPRPPPRARNSVSKRMSMRTVEADTISESDSLEAFLSGRAKSRNSANPMFSGQSNRRRSSGVRALERARSTASRADTASSYTDDNWNYRQSIQGRPYSTAMSVSVYEDDPRQSIYTRPQSQISGMPPPMAPFAKGPSQSSLAQNYSDMIAPLPRFQSEFSMASGRRFDTGDVPPLPSDYSNLINQENGGHNRWYRGSMYSQTDATGPRRGSMRKSPSLSEIPMEGKGRRVSLVRFADKENENPMGYPDHRWRLGENQDRRPVSIENHNGLPRDLTGSVQGDMAFV